MKRKLTPLKLLSICAAIAGLSGCASLRSPVYGGIYTDTRAPLSATSNTAGNRVGEACANSYAWLYAAGDASIEAARRAGGITMITSVDETVTSYAFGAFTKYCSIVRGR